MVSRDDRQQTTAEAPYQRGRVRPAFMTVLALALAIMPMGSAWPCDHRSFEEPLSSQQWYLSWNEYGTRPWDGAGVSVGVIDTGIDATHPELAGAYDAGASRSFLASASCGTDPSCLDPGTDPPGHGTGVAGVIAAAWDGRGIGGASPGVSLVSLKAGDAAGFFSADAIARAVRYGSDAGLDILVMPFTADPWFRYCEDAPGDTSEERAQQASELAAIEDSLDYAADRGVVLVAAAGNQGFDLDHGTVDKFSAGRSDREVNDRCTTMPAQADNVITVGAVDASGVRSSYSNVGAAVDIVAPGGEPLWYDESNVLHGRDTAILTTVPEQVLRRAGLLAADGGAAASEVVSDCDGGSGSCRYYWYVCGTSYAAPQVAAAAAVLLSRGVPASQLRDRLTALASTMGCPATSAGLLCQASASGNTWYGAGALRLAGHRGHH